MNFAGSDPLIWTPSAIAGELNRILGVFDTVNNEMSAASAAGKVSSDEWNRWRATYLSAHDFLTTASHLWGSNVATARQQEQEAGKWRGLIASRGQPLQGPTNLVRTDPPSSGVSYWSLALYGGGAVAAYLGYLYLKSRVVGAKALAGFGSPPSAHVKRARVLIRNIVVNADKAKAQAEIGKCELARHFYEDSVYFNGELHAHANSIGKHRSAFTKAAHLEIPRRAQIAARRAIETHCKQG